MIPQSLDELDPAWLTMSLQRAVPGVMVESVDVVHAADATNFNATLELVHDSSTLPARVFLKLPPVEPERRGRLDWASMGEREVRFYRDLAPHIGFRVPTVFVGELDPETGEFLLLMEHVDSGELTLPDPTAGLGVDLVEAALRDFAELHAHFEVRSRRRSEVPWLRPSGRTSDYGSRLLRQGIDSGATLSSAFVDVAEAYIADRDLLQDAWELGPTTVLHGDAHIGNVFVDGALARLGFFDWGLMTVGSPLRDISYFLTMTLDPAARAATERDLIDIYLSARGHFGAAEISRDDAWTWHRLQSAYTVVASCQAIVVPEGAGARRRAFAEAFVGRAERAVEDLDPLEAMASLA